MIQPHELRIGNILNVSGIDRLVRVTAIFRTHFRCEDKDGVLFVESLRINYTPIPLTEEWLMKAGFVRYGNSSERMLEYKDTTFIIEARDGEYYYSGGQGVMLSRMFTYVHHLQNVFHALTGQELKIEI